MKHTRIILLIALLGMPAVGLPNLRSATITVTEVGDGLDVHTNLRQALADANDGDTIQFDPLLGGRDLPLAAVFGQLVVNKSVTISWVPTVGYNSYLGVDAGQASRVFYISPDKTVTISGLTIRNGLPPGHNALGGGIYNDHATLTLNNCTISGNSNQGFGGGIYNDNGTLTVSRSTLSGNSIWYYGAGIYNDGRNGRATLTITNSTLSGNSASVGGGIYNEGYNGSATLTITNSTLSGNSAPYAGGAIYNGVGGTLTISNGTLSSNSAQYGIGGGIYNVDGGMLAIGDTILNAGSFGENIYNQSPGKVISLGYNLSSDDGGGYLTAAGDRINTDPRLGPLQDNGGPTFTHLPAPDSPAIDGSDPARNMDQRGPGFVRVVNGRADIGAVEVQAAPSPSPTPTPTPTPRPRGRH